MTKLNKHVLCLVGKRFVGPQLDFLISFHPKFQYYLGLNLSWHFRDITMISQWFNTHLLTSNHRCP